MAHEALTAHHDAAEYQKFAQRAPEKPNIVSFIPEVSVETERMRCADEDVVLPPQFDLRHRK